MNWKLIFNPFSKFSEIKLLAFGIVITLIGSFIGHFLNLTYDGVFDAHLSKEVSFLQSLKENFLDISSVFLMLFIAGKIIYKKTRMIDILNISLVSRFPTYISGLFAINPVLERVSKEVLKNMEHPEKIQLATLDLVIVLIISLLSIFMLVYSIILLVNGFRVSTNTKKAKHFVFFIIALILAEVIAKTLVYNI